MVLQKKCVNPKLPIFAFILVALRKLEGRDGDYKPVFELSLCTNHLEYIPFSKNIFTMYICFVIREAVKK